MLICRQEISNGLGGHLANYSYSQQKDILLVRRHDLYVSSIRNTPWLITIQQPFYISVPAYTISLALSKVSIILLYIRVFSGKRFAISCWVTMSLVVAFTLWGCFGFMFMCTPIQAMWDKTIHDPTCMDAKIVYFTNAGFNILTDFIIFGLPLPILSQLQLPRKQKWLLILLFCIGFMYVFNYLTS